jgi:hypothetical protein
VDVRAKGDSWVELGQKAEDYFARRTADAAVLKLDSAKTTELIKALEVLRGPPPEAAEE